MSGAFKDFAVGKFQEGLVKLDACESWRDGRADLHGPFYLGFPRKPGWGEGLLIASLLKRHCEFYGTPIEVFAHESVCTILKDDGLIKAHNLEHEDFRSSGAR